MSNLLLWAAIVVLMAWACQLCGCTVNELSDFKRASYARDDRLYQEGKSDPLEPLFRLFAAE